MSVSLPARACRCATHRPGSLNRSAVPSAYQSPQRSVDAGVVPFLGEKGLGLTATKEIHDVVGPLISLMRKAPSAADDAHTSRPITARVTAVDRAKGLVVLNVGRDQGVEKGFEFVIHRRRQRIAGC